MLQSRVHVATHALRTDRVRRQRSQFEAVTQIIDVQRQWIVGALFTAQGMNTLPGLYGTFGHAANRTVAVVEQCAEQWRRCGNPAATLSQRQRCMFVSEQRSELRVCRLDPGAYTLPAHGDPQRQGVDEHPQCPVGAFAGLHTAQQYGAEHHIATIGNLAQHLGPGQVHQTGGTHPLLSGLSTQAQVQLAIHGKDGFFYITPVALHILQAERQRRLVDITQHVAEKHFMISLADTQPRLSHVVAVWHWRRQGFAFAEQPGLHFMLHHLHGHMIQGHMMEQQHRGDSLIERILGVDQAHQWRLSHIEAVVTRVEAAMQLRADLTVCRVKLKPFKVQLRFAPDHLHR
ncbi:Uncharacterized protein ABJ98_0053 [Pseudomonas syringae pv. aceris]|nr:Uncharacterized protein ABJ98_0053 [Pseudomonas syringae pv. aceris]